MIKVLHVYKTFVGDGVGGVEQVITHIAANSHLSEFKHSVLALASRKAPLCKPSSDLHCLYYKEDIRLASMGISFRLLWDFQKIAQDADIIHYHFPWPFADLMHLFGRIKKPSLVTYHSDIVRQKNLLYLYRPIMHRFLKAMHGIVATSCNYFKSSEVLQRYSEKVTVIPIGLHKAAYALPKEERISHWKKQLPKVFFLFVGVMRYYKGLHILLQAAQQTSFPIVLLGAGPMENELKQQARDLKLNNIYFLGQLAEEDKVALIQLSCAMLFPSHLRSEAFGISLLEGAMYGKPLISCEIGTGTSFINIHNETGFVISPNDSKALKHAMQTLWDDEALALRMGKAAEARYWSLFTADKMVADYEKLYRNILQTTMGEEMSHVSASTLP